MTEEKDKVNEAIANYYKLKHSYENEYYEHYLKEIVNMDVSKNEKKRLFQKLPKPKCVNCARNVGTIFSVKETVQEEQHFYRAQCGDVSNPCPLNIQIEVPNIELTAVVLSNYKIDKIKKDIILAKNDLLFGYIKEEEAFRLFDELSTELKNETLSYETFLEYILHFTDDRERKIELQKKQVELGTTIQEFKDMMKDAKIQNNTQIVNNAVNFYVQTIVPLLNEIQSIKYPINRVENIEGVYHLIQKKNTIEGTYISYDTGKVISFVTGTKSTQKSKTVKVKNSSKNKTKKNMIEFEVIPEPSQQVVADEENIE